MAREWGHQRRREALRGQDSENVTASSRYRWGIRHYEEQFIAISASTGTFPAIAGNEPSEIDD
jgi:hypothetical protein